MAHKGVSRALLGLCPDSAVFDSSYVVADSSNPDKTVVKLLGTGYAKRIIDEHKSNPFLKTYREINPSTWLAYGLAKTSE